MSKSTRGIRVAGIAGLAVSLSIGVAAPAFAVADFKFDRIGGADRYETSTLVDDEFRDGGADVILANGQPGNYADALSANTLAGEKNIPILLTRKDETPASVLQQLKDDGVKNIWVVGGTSVVSDAQVASLTAAGYTVTRVSGADRFGTNNEIIKMSGAAAGNTGLVATGFNFPDALAAGPFSFQGHPLALSTKDSIEDSTVQALKDAGVTKVLIFGGTTVVTPAVEAKLKANGIDTAARFAGEDRSDTSEQAAEYAVKNLGFTNTHVGVASGYVKGYGADALAGGPLEGKEKSPMLVTRDVDNPDDVLDYLKAHASTLKTGHIYGGTAAISAAAQAAMEKAAQTTTSNQKFSVTPNTPATLNVVAGDTAVNDTSDDRQYSVSGLDSTKNYTVALVDAANVTTGTDGQVKFADTNSDNKADGVGSTTVAHISVVNGTPQNADSVTVSGTSTINFTVEGDTTGSVIPVVYQDANSNTALDLVAPATANADPKAPSEDFGIGGKVTYVGEEAALGSSNPTVDSANTTDDYFQSTGGKTYYWDGNDVFQYQGVGITQAEFESMISKGDVLAVSYNPNPAGVSTFNITSDAAPTAVAKPSVSVINADGGATRNDVRVTYTRPADNAQGTSYTLQRRSSTGAGADTTACTADDTWSAYTTVAGATQAPKSGTTDQYVFSDNNVPNGCYEYRVQATNPVSGTTTNGVDSDPVTVPAPNDTTGPKSTYMATTNGSGLSGTLDSGDTIKIVFDEEMAAPNNGDKVRYTDGDGTIVDVTCGTNATCTLNAAAETVNSVSRPAGTVLTVKLTADPTVVSAGTIAGEQILGGTATDQAGNTDLAGNGWDLGGSTDKTLA